MGLAALPQGSHRSLRLGRQGGWSLGPALVTGAGYSRPGSGTRPDSQGIPPDPTSGQCRSHALAF